MTSADTVPTIMVEAQGCRGMVGKAQEEEACGAKPLMLQVLEFPHGVQSPEVAYLPSQVSPWVTVPCVASLSWSNLQWWKPNSMQAQQGQCYGFWNPGGKMCNSWSLGSKTLEQQPKGALPQGTRMLGDGQVC
jgi:hypothetical protein